MDAVYEIKFWSNDLGSKFTLLNSLFRDVKSTKHVDPDKYSCSGYDIGFDVNGTYSLSDGKSFGKIVIIWYFFVVRW